MSELADTSELTTPAAASDVTGLARLLLHVKENNIPYMLAVLVAYQIGILDKAWTYGSGMC